MYITLCRYIINTHDLLMDLVTPINSYLFNFYKEQLPKNYIWDINELMKIMKNYLYVHFIYLTTNF